MSGINCSSIVSQPFSVACIFAYSMTIILPIMLALCLMLSGTYYAQNYASIIGCADDEVKTSYRSAPDLAQHSNAS